MGYLTQTYLIPKIDLFLLIHNIYYMRVCVQTATECGSPPIDIVATTILNLSHNMIAMTTIFVFCNFDRGDELH